MTASGTAPPRDALYMRLGLRLIPFLLLCYFVAMVDRLNVGFAKLQFMKDLHFSEVAFGTAAGILYIGYILFELPSNLMLNRYGVRLTLLRIMGAWGVFTILLAFARSETGFYVLRFLVGAAEAGFFPGIVLYLTYWFPGRYRGKVTSLFAMGVPISGMIAGPVSGWIMTHLASVGGLAGWQWLFVLEGLPAIVLGFVAYLYLSDRPANAPFLTEAEKARIAADLARDFETSPTGTLDSLGGALRSPRIYMLAAVYFAFYSMQSVLLIWVPTILKAVGPMSLVEIGWRAGAISLAGTIGMVALGFSSDRWNERRWHATGCGAAAAAALLLLPAGAGNALLTTALLAVAAAFTFGFLGIFWTIPSAFLDKKAAAGGIALISSIGASGSAISPIFIGWMRDHTGSVQGAIAVLALLMLAAMVLLFFCVPRAPASSVMTARRPALS
jgi:sugar phosphate permease